MTSDPQPQDEQAPDPRESASEVDSVADEAVADEAVADEANDNAGGEPQEASSDEVSSDDAATGDDNSTAAAEEETTEDEENARQWYILKVQVNREESIRRALERRIKVAALEEYFGDIVVPTEDVAEFNKNGKRRIVKKKLYPGYIMINLALNDDTWFLVRETPGIGDFTGSAGKPTPMEAHEVARIVKASAGDSSGEAPVKTAIPFKPGDRVRVKEGYFENFEGDVEAIDEANGRITVMINIFGRSTPVELEHWQVESV